MIPTLTQFYVPVETTITFPEPGIALYLGGEEEVYTVTGTTNITQLKIGTEVFTTDSEMRRRVLPPGVPITITPGTGGGVVYVSKPTTALPGLAVTPIGPARMETGVIGGDDDQESGVTSYALTLTPLLGPGGAAYPDVRVRLGSTTLPTDAVVEVARANGTVVATLTVREQVLDLHGRRWAVFRGAWSYAFTGEAFTCTLKRSGGGTFTANVTPLEATGAYDGYRTGIVVNISGTATVQRTAGGTTQPWPASPQLQFGRFPPVVSALRGTTAQRPTTDLYGLAYFDTDLNKPTWRRSDGVYVDATGTPA